MTTANAKPIPPPTFAPPPKAKPRETTPDDRLSWLANRLAELAPHLEITRYLNRIAVRDPERGTAAILAWEEDRNRWAVIGGLVRGRFSLLNGSFEDPHKALRVFVSRLELDIEPSVLFEAMYPGVIR